MNWIVVKKFPLTTDLTHITGYLRERGIQHHIYEESGEQVIAVVDPRMVEPIAQFINEIERGALIIEQGENPSAAAHTSPIATVLQQLNSTPITALLILLSAVGAIIPVFDSDYILVRWLSFQAVEQNSWQPLSESLSAGQLWRFITPAFLHFGFLHFLFNSLWMWDLGRRIELMSGKVNYLLFFVVTATASNFAQYLWIDNHLFGGMSGVVYALVGFIIVSHKLAPHPLTAVPPAILGFMLFFLVLCMTGVVDYFIDGGVANAAHLGGLLAGCVFAFLTVKRKLPNT